MQAPHKWRYRWRRKSLYARQKKPKPSFVAASTTAGRDGTNGDDSDADFFVRNDDVEEEQTDYPEIAEDQGSSGPKKKAGRGVCNAAQNKENIP